jgi:hypothetical protein
MKVQFTKNDLKNMGERCIRLPYGDPIVYGCRRRGWNYGLYGWNWTAYTLEDFDGTLLEGYRNYPSGVIEPTHEELEELHNAYKCDNHGLLVALLEKVHG